MRPNETLRAWRAGKQTIGAWLSAPGGHSAEVMAHTGFDWLCIDMQHGLIDEGDCFEMLRAISTTNTTPFVRVGWNEPRAIMKVLDAGAYGVVVPLVMLAMVVPVSINGVGVREGGMAMLLAPQGVASEQAVAIALLWFLATIISGLIGGLLFLLDRHPVTTGPLPHAPADVVG